MYEKSKPIQQLTANVESELTRSSKRLDWNDSENDKTGFSPASQSERLVAQVFVWFQTIFGNRWTSNFTDEKTENLMIAEWSHQLAGLSKKDLQRGIDRLADREGRDAYWPPSAIEYRKLCMPQPHELGIPDSEEANQRAIHHEYGYPEVYWAAQKTWLYLHESRMEIARKHFFQVYGEFIKARQNGYEFNWPEWMSDDQAIKQEKKRTLSAEENSQKFDECAKELLKHGIKVNGLKSNQ